MARLLKRIEKLEARITDPHGLIPHSEEWFRVWEAKLERLSAGDNVDLTGMTLEFVDALRARGSEPC